MTPKQFDKAVLKLFGPLLQEHGFTSEGSRYCTFHRKASDEVYHFISPNPMRGGTRYRVMVFPASPVLDPLFAEQFPDDLGIPSDSYSYLSERGVGLDQVQFNCKSEENFVNRFDKTVRNLLTEKAIRYLDQFRSVEDMIPVIKHRFFLGTALHYVGRVAEARPLLEQERERLTAGGSSERVVTASIERINELLQVGT